MAAENQLTSDATDVPRWMSDMKFRVGSLVAILTTLATVGILTAGMVIFQDAFLTEHLIFLYLLPITALSIYFGSIPALVVAIASVAAAAYFVFPPPISLRVSDPLHIAELVFFAVLAFLASKATSGLSRTDRT